VDVERGGRRVVVRSEGAATIARAPVDVDCESDVGKGARDCGRERRWDIVILQTGTAEATASGLSMTSSNVPRPPEAEEFDLQGVRILIVEDSWHLGISLKSHLRALGAEVMGPVATASDAERLISGLTPDVALVDFNLRGGELAHGLIDRLHNQGIRIVVISGYAEVPLAPGKVAATLQKPIAEEQLLAALRSTTKAAQ
jgi:CheY-like chemotaxis protein